MELDAAIAELDALVRELEREGDARALRALELVDAIHRPALELLARGEGDHPLARLLLAMYDLAPVPDAVRAEEALDAVRARLHERGGDVAVAGADGAAVRVRYRGACRGEDGEGRALRAEAEAALRAAGFTAVTAEEPPEPGVALPLAPAPAARRPVDAR